MKSATQVDLYHKKQNSRTLRLRPLYVNNPQERVTIKVPHLHLFIFLDIQIEKMYVTSQRKKL